MTPQLIKKQSAAPRVLVLCHGNICRSPLAAIILSKQLGEAAVRGRGFSSKQGQRAAKKVREFAARAGYALSTHRSKQISQVDVDRATLIVYMDSGNRRRLAVLPGAVEKAECLASWVGLTRLSDPAFVRRGPELERLLGLVAEAAKRLGQELLAQQ